MTIRLPNADRAFVDPAKITEYLLDATHPDNGGKAEFFRLFGFSEARPYQLAAALVTHAQANRVGRTEQSEFGEK